MNRKVAKVPGKSRGPSITLKVMAGDTIEISGKAFYNMDKTLPGKGVNIAPIVGSAIAAMTSPVGAVLDEAAQLALDLGAEASQSVILAQVPKKDDQNNDVKPESGINFVLYNNGMEVVEANTGVMLVEDRINEIQVLASDRLIMSEAGFLEVFINNEAQTPVYYDNLMITQTNSRVMEINAYYPFGSIIPQLSVIAAREEYNGYKYNSKELQTQLNLNWGDHGARMADYTTGRWMCPDPLSEKYYNISPYAFAGNNPIRYIDPNGMNLDDYLLKKNGEIVLEERKPKDPTDKLIAEDGSSITVSKNKNGESVLSSLADKSKNFKNQQHLKPEGVTVEGNYAITQSGSEAKKVFKFAAENSTVEWGINNYKNGDWVIGTLHEGSQAPNFVNLNSYYSIENTLYDAHSHGGTSHDVDFWPSYPWDIDAAAKIKQHNPNAVIKLFMPQNPTRKWMDLPGPYDYNRRQYIYKIRSEGEQYLKSIRR